MNDARWIFRYSRTLYTWKVDKLALIGKLAYLLLSWWICCPCHHHMEFLYWHIKYHTTHYEPCGGETISKKFEFFFRLGLPFHSTSTGTRVFYLQINYLHLLKTWFLTTPLIYRPKTSCLASKTIFFLTMICFSFVFFDWYKKISFLLNILFWYIFK